MVQPTLTPDNCILHGITQFTKAQEDKPSALTDKHLEAIAALREIFFQWAGNKPGP